MSEMVRDSRRYDEAADRDPNTGELPSRTRSSRKRIRDDMRIVQAFSTWCTENTTMRRFLLYRECAHADKNSGDNADVNRAVPSGAYFISAQDTSDADTSAMLSPTEPPPADSSRGVVFS